MLSVTKKSAGVLLYRFNGGEIEFFLVHPGGPLFFNKDDGVWSIPKGEFEDETPIEAAKREFFEETGVKIEGNLIELKPGKQKNGKLVYAFAKEQNFDTTKLKSNTFKIFGKEFPEVDRAEWFKKDIAVKKIVPGQDAIILELVEMIKSEKNR